MITFCRRTFGVYFLGIWELADLSTVPRFWLSLPLIPDVDQANELKWLTTPAANGRHLHPSALPAATALPLGSPELYRRQRRQRWRRLFNLYSICCRFAACCSAAASTVIIYPFSGPILFTILCCAHTFRKHYTNNTAVQSQCCRSEKWKTNRESIYIAK